MAASRRLAQVNELLRREISRAVGALLELSTGALVTVTSVDAGVDLQHATVWVSVLPSAARERVVKLLQGRAAELHAAVFRAVRFRPVPALHFRSDDTEERAADVEALLDRLPKSGA